MKSLPILLNIIQSGSLSRSAIRDRFDDIPVRTCDRYLSELVRQDYLSRTSIGREVTYVPTQKAITEHYFSVEFFLRPLKPFSWDFLRNYRPNEMHFLSTKHMMSLQKSQSSKALGTLDYAGNQRAIENMLIDMSFSSSKLEGNTYTYLDTEKLIKMGQESDTRTQFEAQMILNHKYALQYCLDIRHEGMYTKRHFYDVHSLLAKNLIRADRLGVIRSEPVKIGGSAYTPLDNPMQLMEAFEVFLEKINTIRHPFEQALFILVFIPYFQLFYDVNKRTSRIAANIPLLRSGLPPLTLLGIESDVYTHAMLHVYERQDVTMIADVVVTNYLKNMNRYV